MSPRETLPPRALTRIADATLDASPVGGLTHDFYRYPARFAPAFARAAIEALTEPGDVVLDPFVGGGTTLVESSATGRLSVGVDINPLATFVTRTKTRVYSEDVLDSVREWALGLDAALDIRRPEPRYGSWKADGYLRNVSSPETWRIRKLIAQGVHASASLKISGANQLARCSLLRTGQWALDLRSEVPSVDQFRMQLASNIDNMVAGARAFAGACKAVKLSKPPRVLTASTAKLRIDMFEKSGPPALVLASPPYPGVYALYHRWKVQSRRETPFPYWIANCRDGAGHSHYTLGRPKPTEIDTYFERLAKAYGRLRRVVGPSSWLVQIVGFSAPLIQLPKFLDAMSSSGFREVSTNAIANASDGRLWRDVPGRRWFALNRDGAPTAREVLLLHRPV